MAVGYHPGWEDTIWPSVASAAVSAADWVSDKLDLHWVPADPAYRGAWNQKQEDKYKEAFRQSKQQRDQQRHASRLPSRRSRPSAYHLPPSYLEQARQWLNPSWDYKWSRERRHRSVGPFSVAPSFRDRRSFRRYNRRFWRSQNHLALRLPRPIRSRRQLAPRSRFNELYFTPNRLPPGWRRALQRERAAAQSSRRLFQ